MKCSKCNKKIIFKRKYCPNCGNELKYSPKKISINKQIIITILIILLIITSLTLIILKEKYNERNIAIKYFESLITQDNIKGFKYIDATESKFINPNTFKKVIEKDKELSKVINYTVQDINYSKNKEEAIITISYITKKNKKHQTKQIVLINKGKKYIFYTNWKVKTNKVISNNYKLSVPKEYNIKLDGIKLTNKELKANNKKYNVYIIKKIFIGEYKVTVKYKNMDLESKIFVQNKNSNSHINNLYLPKQTSTQLTKQLVGQLEALYKNSIKSNSYKSVSKKLTLTKDSKVKDIYNDLLVTTNVYYSQLKDFKVKDYRLLSTRLDKNVKINIIIKYKYKINQYGNIKEKTKEDNIEFIVKKENDKYKIYDINNLNYYFNN